MSKKLSGVLCALLMTVLMTSCSGSEGKQCVPCGNDSNVTSGTSLLSGSGAPSNDLGKDGDSYIDLDTLNFYVKENGVWVLKSNLSGSDPYNLQGLELFPLDDGTYSIGVGTAVNLKHIDIPSEYKGTPITTIMQNGFCYGGWHGIEGDEYFYSENICKYETITLPDTLKKIGILAFGGSQLKELDIPDNVEIIERSALYGCSSLVSVILPESIKTIECCAFSSNSLEHLFYEGTKAKWESVNVDDSYLRYANNAKLYYYSESAPADDGFYWHYLNNEPVIWGNN